MSLLNSALRAAEERQNQPRPAGAYIGQRANERRGRGWLVMLVLTVLALTLATGAWWWFAGARPMAVASPEPVPEAVPEAAPRQEMAVVSARPEPLSAPEPEPEPEPEPQSRPEPVTETEPVSVSAAPEPTPEPVTPLQAVPEAKKTEPAQAQAARPVPVPADPKPEAAAAPGPDASLPAPDIAEREPPAPVKQPRETPGARDLRTSRALSQLLAEGRNVQAREQLRDITRQQEAPRSREVYAREMLIAGRPGQALEWLPEEHTQNDADLRLLRARAILQQGDANLAVQTLLARVPAVADHPEYRVTLATLLQQAGQAEEAAGHWSELIAFDDSQAIWWLGLAIALETGGRRQSAWRAYAQASSLPGLPARLENYAKERLNALQAGS